MKRKLLALMALIILIAVSFTGCSKDSPQKDIYAQLNDMVNSDYPKYSVSVSSKFDETTLSSSYIVVTYKGSSSVSYSYEQLNPIEIVEGRAVMPSEYMSVKTGSVTIKDGKITNMDGDEINVDLKDINIPKISFDESFFKNTEISSNKFTADVIKPTEALGYTGCSDVKITIEFENTKFRVLKVSYKSERNSIVNIIYSFSNK